MVNKKLVALITAGTIVLGGATTAFAANGNFKEAIQTVKQSIQKNVETLKGKKGLVAKAVESKKAELGFKQVDKASAQTQLNQIKSLKTDLQKLREGYKAAKQAKDTDKMAALQTQITSKMDEINKAVQALAPIREQVKKNKEIREEMESVKEELRDKLQQGQAIGKDNEAIKKDVKDLREQLKAAVKDKNQDEISSLTDQIVAKLNTLNDNLTKLNNLRDDASNTVNAWKP